MVKHKPSQKLLDHYRDLYAALGRGHMESLLDDIYHIHLLTPLEKFTIRQVMREALK